MTSRKFDDFDPYAENYREIHNRNIRLSGADSYYFASMKANIVTSYETIQEADFLDVGCGDGACEMFISHEKPDWNLTGTDISESSIKIARQRNISTAEFRVTEGVLLPFADNSFDIVFIAGVLHHIDQSMHEVVLKEILRVLKPMGRLHLFEHNPLNPLTRHLVNTCEFDRDAHLLSHEFCVDIIKNTGFRIQEKRFIIFFPRWKWLRWILPLEKFLSKVPLGGQYYLVCEKP